MTLTIDPLLQAQSLSVQNRPPVNGGMLRFGRDLRTALLPAPGTREREFTLRQYRHNPYSTMFRAAAAGVVKRVQTLPFIVKARDVDTWQDMLMNADFGSWDRFVAKTVGNYLYHDAGAWVELIAPGDPRFAPDGPIVGIAALDTLRVYPTGNVTYPAIYYDPYGKLHLMHYTRVMQLVDNEYSEEYLAGYGECAQTRAIVPIRREVLINQYIESFLDDKPRPGIRLWQNIDKELVEAALAEKERDQMTDDGGTWGNVVNLYGLDTAEPADLKEYANAKAPEGFDFDKYKNELALEMASCIGLDIQDFWQITSSGIGTGTQSEILAQKSRGKAFGNLVKRLTRMINQALPKRCEFSFEYRDPQEDKEEAEKAQLWGDTITVLSPYLKTDEIRQMAVNQIPALKDVLLDTDGNIRSLNDEDPEPAPIADDGDGSVTGLLENYVNSGAQSVELTSALENYLDGGAQPPDQRLTAVLERFTQKSFIGTGVDFSKYIRSFFRVGQAQNFPAAIMRATFREELYTAGLKAYDDGMREGGADPAALDALEMENKRRKVGEWLALQNDYINKLVDDINAGIVTADNIRVRSDMWVSKSLRAIFYAGMQDADGEKLYTWKLGKTEDHCETCLLLNGQTHKISDYLAAGMYPGSQLLKCKGFNCDCRFEKAHGRASGRLPGTKPGPFAALTDALGGFLRRLVRA
jgi:hypothetical protein